MKNHTMTPETITRYRRAATRPSVFEQVEKLNTLSWHHETLDLVLGQKTLAAGAEKLWLATAIRLGATPAQTAAEAHLKITYLESCAHAWVLPNARVGEHLIGAALIMGAISAEKRRWNHPAESGKPN